MRMAMTTGVLAARMPESADYDTCWQQLEAAMNSSMVNRAVYGRLGFTVIGCYCASNMAHRASSDCCRLSFRFLFNVASLARAQLHQRILYCASS